MLARLRELAAWNFVVSIVLAIAWFAWQGTLGLLQTDPSRMRINRVPLGAAFLVLVQVALLVMYRKRGELIPLVRVFATLLGTVQLLQSVVVAWLAALMYDQPFPTATHEVSWYLCFSNFLFALFAPPSAPAPPVDDNPAGTDDDNPAGTVEDKPHADR